MVEDIITSVIATTTDTFQWFVDSTLFLVIKIFLVIYSTVLIVDVILLVYLGDVRKQVRSMRTGSSARKASKSADMREWHAIMQRAESTDAQQYLVAILEADRFVYRSLETQGYSGATFAERLSQVPRGSFTSLDAVRDVHQLSNKIVQDEKIVLTQEQARNALGVYQKFLEDIDIL
jgi:hypothetical protein